MNRRAFISSLTRSGIGLAASVTFGGASCARKKISGLQGGKSKRVNILFLMDDQHRADAVSYENKWVKTPNLERLAEEGARFTRAYSSVPSCIAQKKSQCFGRNFPES